MGGDEFVEESVVVLAEEAQVLDLVFEVGDTLDTHAEGKAGIFFRVDAAGVGHGRVDHAAAEDFDPAGAFAERAALAATKVTADIHFGRGLGEGEVARAETYLGLGAEHLAGEVEQCLA